jgi:hypothetical protein
MSASGCCRPRRTEPQYDIVGETPLLRESKAASPDNRVRCWMSRSFAYGPEPARRYEAAIATAARLGAASCWWPATIPTRPGDRRLRTRSADLAGRYGPALAGLEIMPWTDAMDLTQAARIVERSGRAPTHAALLVDPFHFSRSRQAARGIAAIPPSRLHYLQLCDAPPALPPTKDAIIAEARAERLFPGEGGIDLVGLLRADAARRSAQHRGADRPRSHAASARSSGAPCARRDAAQSSRSSTPRGAP